MSAFIAFEYFFEKNYFFEYFFENFFETFGMIKPLWRLALMYGIQNTVELLEYNDIFGPRYKMYKAFGKEAD